MKSVRSTSRELLAIGLVLGLPVAFGLGMIAGELYMRFAGGLCLP